VHLLPQRGLVVGEVEREAHATAAFDVDGVIQALGKLAQTGTWRKGDRPIPVTALARRAQAERTPGRSSHRNLEVACRRRCLW
jgi:hypothetical protein